MTTFQLDPSIAVWIVLPIFAITTLVTLLRQGFADLNQKRSAAAGEDGGAGGILPGAKQTLTDVHVKNVASMSRLLRLAAGVIPASRMKPRKAYFAENKLTQPPQAGPNPFQAMMSQDPSKMAGAMKYNMVFLVLNAGAAYLISYLFSECVVARMPFDLSRSFKPVLQRGIDVDALDPSFVSALSWYFLVLFCSSSFLYIVNLIFQLSKSPSVSALEAIDPMMGAMMSAGASQNPMGAVEPSKIFGAEIDAWKMALENPPFLPDVHKHAAFSIRRSL